MPFPRWSGLLCVILVHLGALDVPAWDRLRELATSAPAEAREQLRRMHPDDAEARLAILLIEARLARPADAAQVPAWSAHWLPLLPAPADCTTLAPALVQEIANHWAWAGDDDRLAAFLAATPPGGPAERQALLAWCASRLAGLRNDWPRAKEAAKRGLADLDAGAHREQLGRWRTALAAEFDTAQRMEGLRDHGLGHRLYVEAQQSRLQQRDYALAQARFERIVTAEQASRVAPQAGPRRSNDPAIGRLPIDPIYAAAARMLRGACLLNRNQLPEAEAALTAAAAEASQFSGEALRLLAEVALERGDPATAGARLDQALDWAEHHGDGQDLPDAPGLDGMRTDPPLAMPGRDPRGTQPWPDELPEHLTGAGLVPWYGARLRHLCLIRRSLVRFLGGDLDAALADVAATAAVDPGSATRLAYGYRQGGLLATAAELAQVAPPRRSAVLAADQWFELGRWVDAREAYQRIADRHPGALNPGEEAYLAYAILCCDLRCGLDGPAAVARLEAFERRHPRTPSLARARELLVLCLASDQLPRRLAILDSIVRDYPGTAHEPRAMATQVLLTTEADPAYARRRAREIIARFPGSEAADRASRTLAALAAGPRP